MVDKKFCIKKILKKYSNTQQPIVEQQERKSTERHIQFSCTKSQPGFKFVRVKQLDSLKRKKTNKQRFVQRNSQKKRQSGGFFNPYDDNNIELNEQEKKQLKQTNNKLYQKLGLKNIKAVGINKMKRELDDMMNYLEYSKLPSQYVREFQKILSE